MTDSTESALVQIASKAAGIGLVERPCERRTFACAHHDTRESKVSDDGAVAVCGWQERPWRTREDPFGEVWDAVQKQIQESPSLEAKTLG